MTLEGLIYAVYINLLTRQRCCAVIHHEHKMVPAIFQGGGIDSVYLIAKSIEANEVVKMVNVVVVAG